MTLDEYLAMSDLPGMIEALRKAALRGEVLPAEAAAKIERLQSAWERCQANKIPLRDASPSAPEPL